MDHTWHHKRTDKSDSSCAEDLNLHHKKTCLPDDSYTSLSEDDSLELLSEEQIESSWFGDSEDEELISNFKNMKFVKSNIIELPKNLKEQAEISPIFTRESMIIANIDHSALESTPKEVYERGSIRYQGTNIKTIYFDEETFTNIKSDELNITHNIESPISDRETSLNKTFSTINILNKTLPSVMNTDETESNFKKREESIQKNITESLNSTFNETRSYACEPKKYELPVEAKRVDKLLSRTVTKMKKKDELSENRPISTVTNVKDFSQTGTKKKIYKSDRTLEPNLSKKSSPKTDPKKNVKNKPTILSTSNRSLKELSSFDMSSPDSLGNCNPEISPYEKRAIGKKALNLSFKKMDKEPMTQSEKDKLLIKEIHLKNEEYTKKKWKETANLKGFADYKLSLHCTLKEIKKIKSIRPLEIPTIRLVEEPFVEQRRGQTFISRLPRRSTQIGKPQMRSQGTRQLSGREPDSPAPQRMPSYCTRQLSGREPVCPAPQRMPSYCTRQLSGREPVHPAPQRMPSYSRTLGQPIAVDHVPPLPLGRPGEYQILPSGRRSRIPTFGQRAHGPQAIFGTSSPFESTVRRQSSNIPKKTAHGPTFPK